MSQSVYFPVQMLGIAITASKTMRQLLRDDLTTCLRFIGGVGWKLQSPSQEKKHKLWVPSMPYQWLLNHNGTCADSATNSTKDTWSSQSMHGQSKNAALFLYFKHSHFKLCPEKSTTHNGCFLANTPFCSGGRLDSWAEEAGAPTPKKVPWNLRSLFAIDSV